MRKAEGDIFACLGGRPHGNALDASLNEDLTG